MTKKTNSSRFSSQKNSCFGRASCLRLEGPALRGHRWQLMKVATSKRSEAKEAERAVVPGGCFELLLGWVFLFWGLLETVFLDFFLVVLGQMAWTNEGFSLCCFWSGLRCLLHPFWWFWTSRRCLSFCGGFQSMSTVVFSYASESKIPWEHLRSTFEKK